MLIMTIDEFYRLNTLSEKIVHRTASVNELKEFNSLLDAWGNCNEFNLTLGLRNQPD